MSVSLKRPWRVRKRHDLLAVYRVYVKWAVTNQLIGCITAKYHNCVCQHVFLTFLENISDTQSSEHIVIFLITLCVMYCCKRNLQHMMRV